MLSARLCERCPSARPLGIARASGYQLSFDKIGRDGSGKATLRASGESGLTVTGIVYEIAVAERTELDRAEVNYLRDDEFPVTMAGNIAGLYTSTYIAPPTSCRKDLAPFDWYLALILAGAEEHGLPDTDIMSLRHIRTITDYDDKRSTRMMRLAGHSF